LKNHDLKKKSDSFDLNQIFYLNQNFFSKKNHIFTSFSLYYAVKHEYIDKTVENLSSIVSCMLHRIKVAEPMSVQEAQLPLRKQGVSNVFLSS